MKKIAVGLLALAAPVVLLAQTVIIILVMATAVVAGGVYIYVLEKNAQLSGMHWVVLEVRHGHSWSPVLTNRVPISKEPSFPAFFIAVDTNRNIPELCRVRLAEPDEIPGNFAPQLLPDNYPYRPILYNEDMTRKSED